MVVPVEREDAAKLIRLVGACWQRFKVTNMDETVTAWAHLLQVPFRSAVDAVESFVREGATFPPELPEILARAQELALEAAGSVPTVDEAWREVCDGIRKFDVYWQAEQIPWSHPAVLEAVQVLGWEALLLSENQIADRAHFQRVYPDIRKRNARTPARQGVPPGLPRFFADIRPAPCWISGTPRVCFRVDLSSGSLYTADVISVITNGVEERLPELIAGTETPALMAAGGV